MAFVFNNNSSTNALNNLNRTNKNLSSTKEWISSGLRTNMAADDGAGLGFAENPDAAPRSPRRGRRKAKDAIAVIQVALPVTNNKVQSYQVFDSVLLRDSRVQRGTIRRNLG